MRQRYRQDPNTGKLQPIGGQQEATTHSIISEITPFQSHVDGSWITTRRELEDHNKRNDVRPMDEFSDTIEARTKRRAAVHGEGNFDTAERIESLKLAFELDRDGRSENDKRQIVENFIQHNQHGK